LRRLEREGNALSFDWAFLDGKVASSDGSHTYLWDLESGKRSQLPFVSRGLASHPDGIHLLVPRQRHATILNTNSMERRRIYLDGSDVDAARFSREGDYVVVAHKGRVELFELTSRRPFARRVVGDSTTGLFVTSGGRIVVTSAGSASVYDVAIETRPPAVVKREVERILKPRR